MKILKKIALVLLALVVIMQFIRPPRNIAEQNSQNDISTLVNIPSDVQNILRTSCYDCHSNATMYPWYAEIQPVGWWLNSHIRDAQGELNFSEFAAYRPRRQFIKLSQITEQVEQGEMPLPSYTLIHTDAVLSDEQKQALFAWVTSAKDSLKAKYPPDSLRRRN